MNANDELSLTIGRIVRAAAHLELTARHMWLMMVGGSLAMHLAPSGMDPLIKGIRDMVKQLDLSDDRRIAAMAALKAAEDANTLRHRAVHDIWMQREEDDDWSRQQSPGRGVIGGTVTTVPIEELRSHVEQITRATYRISTLGFALWPYKPDRPNFVDPLSEQNWAIVRDEFDVMLNGGIRPRLSAHES